MKVLRCRFQALAVNCVEKNSTETAARATCLNRGRSRIKAGSNRAPEGNRGPDLYSRKYGIDREIERGGGEREREREGG